MLTRKAASPAFGRNESLSLKGLAIMLMIFHHCFLAPERYAGNEVVFLTSEPLLNKVALSFKICVSVFVFITAYGISLKMRRIPIQDPRIGGACARLQWERLVKLIGNFIFVFLLVDLFALFYDPGRFAYVYGSSLKSAGYFILDMLGLAQLFGTPTFLATYWYYSLAILLVALTPLCWMLAVHYGSGTLFAVIGFFTFVVPIPNPNFSQYMFAMGAGIFAERHDLFDRICLGSASHLSSSVGGRIVRLLVYLILLFALMAVRQASLGTPLTAVLNAIVVLVLVAFCCDFLFRHNPLSVSLVELGKHSGNIFLVHNFIRAVWFYTWTYSFRYPLLIFAVLLLVSLAISIGIESLKKAVRFPTLLARIAAYQPRL